MTTWADPDQCRIPEADKFCISSNAVSTLKSWEKFKQTAQAFFDLHCITDRDEKKRALLQIGGPALQHIYVPLEKVHNMGALLARDPYAFAINILDEHFKSMANKANERLNFRLTRQHYFQSIETFYNSLRHQANNCDFYDENRAIVDQILLGTSYTELRSKILQNHLDNPDEIIELGKKMEKSGRLVRSHPIMVHQGWAALDIPFYFTIILSLGLYVLGFPGVGIFVALAYLFIRELTIH